MEQKEQTDDQNGAVTETSPFMNMEVYRAEIDDVLTRREKQRVQNEEECKEFKDKLGQLQKPSTEVGCVGLALSGGGIRSATFNLGLLQALDKQGIFKQVDYLSTVSGGSYIGSCLSSVLAGNSTRHPATTVTAGSEVDKQSEPSETAENECVAFPFTHKKGEPESLLFRHLRDYSNYLAPRGFLDHLQVPGLLLRGILINFLIVLPYIIIAALITVTLKSNPEDLETHILADLWIFSWLLNDHFIITKSLLIFMFFLLIFYQLWQHIIHRVWTSMPSTNHLLNNINWLIRDNYRRITGIVFFLTGAVAFIELQPLAIQRIGVVLKLQAESDWITLTQDFLRRNQELLSGGSMTFGAITTLFAGKIAQKISRWTGRFWLYLISAIGFFVLWFIYLKLSQWAIFAGADLFPDDAPLYLKPDWLDFSQGTVLTGYAIALTGLFLYSQFFVDVNKTSLHNYYRDRLSKAYLFDRTGENGKEPLRHNDEQPLSELDTECGPYHLINAALNIRSSKEMNRRGRDADFFIFSKRCVGSELTGYCRTTNLEAIDKHLNLGTAMAISGAAAAPNMGRVTVKPLVFIMALLNIRLGYWLPNPKLIDRIGMIRRAVKQVSRVGPIYLIREMIGDLDEKSWNINLSDGGHIENLGIYELLRRRCKFIIASDAEADPELKFGGLAHLMRVARIDMGIKIVLNLDPIRKKKSGWSQTHFVKGTIDYGNGETGELLYVKSSVTGEEEEYIKEYRARHPDFPHETTADQFFDEAQFECYRALGHHITDGLFNNEQTNRQDRDALTVEGWFAQI
jgi:hypothetical protein